MQYGSVLVITNIYSLSWALPDGYDINYDIDMCSQNTRGHVHIIITSSHMIITTLFWWGVLDNNPNVSCVFLVKAII